MKRITTKQLTTTALLLAMCIVFQALKSLSVYITGSAVNCILVIATIYCGLFSGTCIAILTPVIAYFIGATPVINMIPLMLPVIMLGNEVLVLCIWLFAKKKKEIGMALGCIGKAGFLWLSVWYLILPVFGQNLPGKMVGVVKVTFSLTQLITAVIGCALAWVLLTGYRAVFTLSED